MFKIPVLNAILYLSVSRSLSTITPRMLHSYIVPRFKVQPTCFHHSIYLVHMTRIRLDLTSLDLSPAGILMFLPWQLSLLCLYALALASSETTRSTTRAIKIDFRALETEGGGALETDGGALETGNRGRWSTENKCLCTENSWKWKADR